MYSQQLSGPPPYNPNGFNNSPVYQKEPSYNQPEITERGWGVSSSSSSSSISKSEQVPSGWKVINIYRDSLAGYSLVDANDAPLYTVSNSPFSSADVRLLPHKSVTPPDTTPPTYAAAKFHTFSSKVDICLGDYKSQSDPWDTMSMRKADGFVHERWRWGMDPSLLPPGLRIVHPGKKKGKGAGQVEFLWRRPGDSVWSEGWELVVDRDGEGKGEVLASFKEPTCSLKKKGTLQMMAGIGHAWELLVITTLNAVTEKETEQIVKLCT